MKRKFTHSCKLPLRWLSLVVMMLMGMIEVHAGCQTYYYKVTVTPSPSRGGRVYVTKSQNETPTFNQDGARSITGNQYTIGYGETGVYMYAQANDNYLFSHWEDSDGNSVGTVGSTSYNATIQFNSTSQSNPTAINYKAFFIAQTGLIKVRSANPTRGSVGIDNPDNQDGNVVTLTAYPDVSNGVLFLGWTKDGGTEYVSTDNPYVLTANNNTKGTYYAHFSEAADKVYVRIQNKKTGRFISFYGNNNGSGVTFHTRTVDGNTRNDGFKFDNCWELLSEEKALGNPETVFLRAGHPGSTGITTNAYLTAHDIAYTNLIHETTGQTQEHLLTFEKSGDAYYIYTIFESDGGTMRSYFCDEGTDWLVMKSTQNTGIDPEYYQWYVYTLDENNVDGSFSANTKEKFAREGKYYTTMFTDFPYKCIDGVKAYYLHINTEEFNHEMDEHVLRFTEVPDGKVPANMAVVLECENAQDKSSGVVNRLIPLIASENNPVPSVSDFFPDNAPQFLHGYVLVNNKNWVTNNTATMYVLSTDNPNKENHLGFYHSTKANMTPNKAYLDSRVDVSNNLNASQVTIAFGKDSEGNTNRIALRELFVDDDDAPIYDLQGRQMTGGLPKGIYIRNGKKFIVK